MERRSLEGDKCAGATRTGAKHATRLGLLAAGLTFTLGAARGAMPRDQTVRYVLGDEAPRVQQVEARWAVRQAAAGEREDWLRSVTFGYRLGQAPRVITHEPRLPDGDYDVRIEIVTSDGERAGQVTRVVDRRVQLSSRAVTSIELGRSGPVHP